MSFRSPDALGVEEGGVAESKVSSTSRRLRAAHSTSAGGRQGRRCGRGGIRRRRSNVAEEDAWGGGGFPFSLFFCRLHLLAALINSQGGWVSRFCDYNAIQVYRSVIYPRWPLLLCTSGDSVQASGGWKRRRYFAVFSTYPCTVVARAMQFLSGPLIGVVSCFSEINFISAKKPSSSSPAVGISNE